MAKKPKLSVAEQIQHMKEQGIRFDIISEEQAADFLRNNTYYFKLKSYAKNYEKYKQGEKINRYVNLEFAYLQELSTLDSLLRKFIIRTCLDIEHFLKVQMLTDFQKNPQEDGYSIIEKFFRAFPDVRDDIIVKKSNSNCFDLIEKYQDNFAIWNIVEVLTFRQFVDLYELYFSFYDRYANMKGCLKPVQFIRNAAAHNNCLLNNLKALNGRQIQTNKRVENYVATIPTIKQRMRNVKMQTPVIHDFVTMMFVFKNVVTSKKTVVYTCQELKLLQERLNKRKEYFEKNSLIASHFLFLNRFINFIIEDFANE